jgi:hypothetical protein
MRYGIAALAALLTATAALPQELGVSSAPFTRVEAQALSDVWPEIREAPAWNSIDWIAAGLNHAPGNPKAQELMAAHWDEMRRVEYFERIDWEEVLNGDRGRRARRAADDRSPDGQGVSGPFTREETLLMSRVWPRIREAARYDDIDWRALGIREPGDRDAHRIMAGHWGRLREAARFEDIDWNTTVASQRSQVRR